MRLSIHTRFFCLASLVSMSPTISMVLVIGGPARCPALYVGSISGGASILLFFDFATVGLGWSGTGTVIFSCTAIPFTLCDVPSPLNVSSRRSMLSHAKVVKRPGRMLLGSVGQTLDVDNFYMHKAVSISSICEYATQCPRRLRMFNN